MAIQPSRRELLFAAAGALVTIATPSQAAAPIFYRNPGCGCCHLWSEKMASAGLPVTLLDSDDLAGELKRLGVPSELEGCHVGEINGYVVSGHVPPEDIKRLLAEKPNALGLAVSGMPAGSPGMEGGSSEPYTVFLFQRDGSTTAFAEHG
jgi:hypothetical protein